VGWPVELAASLVGVELDFPAIFKATEAQDTKAAGIVSAITLLRNTFGDKNDSWFRARDIRDLLDKGERVRERTYSVTSRTTSDEAAVQKARDFLEMVGELEGKAYRSPTAQIIGRALARIVDRTVNLDDTTRGVLRSRLLHGNTAFKVEVRHKGEGGKYSSDQPPERPLNCPTSPPPHPEGGYFDDQAEQGGLVDPPEGQSEPETAKYSPTPPKPKRQRARNKTSERPQPEGEEIDELW
jgi:hypothetical protein